MTPGIRPVGPGADEARLHEAARNDPAAVLDAALNAGITEDEIRAYTDHIERHADSELAARIHANLVSLLVLSDRTLDVKSSLKADIARLRGGPA